MRRAVRERLIAGDSDDKVYGFMVARYGDYVLLKPPFKPRHAGAVAGRAGAAAGRRWRAAVGRAPAARCACDSASAQRRGAGTTGSHPSRRGASRRSRMRQIAKDLTLRRARRAVSKGADQRLTLMLEFLLALLTTATVGALLIPLLRTRVEATNRLDNDLAVYRDQLAELERERAAGTVPEAEATAARVEIERRILTAAERDAQIGTAAAADAQPLRGAGALPGDPAVRARPLSLGRPSRPASAPFTPAPRAARGAGARASPTSSPRPAPGWPRIPTTRRRCRRWPRR